ncbi:GFA family protein [Wenxinia saemankumensis]|uniref:Uncharacterized conserved protein n=1 Tax=Wenxinia saemankumensis TaxID=1447782 RepID=A0A1M6FRI5_9RHOB|nr:GFA family protein [Wenxinia saemankumensis]SHJ00284.1 Uncharacterized conserved protein [Wenxinia saemankumensis]
MDGAGESAIRGACLCGAVTIAAVPAQPRLWACHCGYCRTWTGSVQVGFEAAPDGVSVEGPVRTRRPTDFSERAWCDSCGTGLWMRDAEEGSPYEFTAGLFPATRDWPLRSENYVDRAWHALRLPGDHRRLTQAEYEAANRHVPDAGAAP